jgi:hypothetical protein
MTQPKQAPQPRRRSKKQRSAADPVVSVRPSKIADRLIRYDTVGTAVFVLAAALGAASRKLDALAAAVSIILFAIGSVAMLIAFLRAVGRSRTETIGIGGLYFLAGTTAPAPVRRIFMVLLAVQTVVGVAAAASRPFTELAACVLAPVFGLGLAGLWGARNGSFAMRPSPASRESRSRSANRPE